MTISTVTGTGTKADIVQLAYQLEEANRDAEKYARLLDEAHDKAAEVELSLVREMDRRGLKSIRTYDTVIRKDPQSGRLDVITVPSVHDIARDDESVNVD